MRDCVGLWMLAEGKDPSKATFADASTGVRPDRAGRGQTARCAVHRQRLRRRPRRTATSSPRWHGRATSCSCSQNNPDLKFVMPDEGGMLFSDNMMILATSEHVADAEAWINYVYDPEHAAQITAEVQYISPVKGVADELTKIDARARREPADLPARRRPAAAVHLRPADRRRGEAVQHRASSRSKRLSRWPAAARAQRKRRGSTPYALLAPGMLVAHPVLHGADLVPAADRAVGGRRDRATRASCGSWANFSDSWRTVPAPVPAVVLVRAARAPCSASPSATRSPT